MVIFNLDDHQVFTLLRALDGLDDGGGAVASVIRTQANLCEKCDRPRDQAGHCPACDKGCACDDDAGFADDRDGEGTCVVCRGSGEVEGSECRACGGSGRHEEAADYGDRDANDDDGQPDSLKERQDFAGDDEPGGYGDCDDGF